MRSSVVETDEADLDWLATFEDDLTMAIAVRDWEQAVRLVKRGQSRYTGERE